MLKSNSLVDAAEVARLQEQLVDGKKTKFSTPFSKTNRGSSFSLLKLSQPACKPYQVTNTRLDLQI